MYLLDTNVLSELRKSDSGKADSNVIGWFSRRALEQLHISVITVMELEIGVLRMERRDPIQGSMLRRWLTGNLIKSFQGRILPISEKIALRCASLHVPDMCSERDALIAATALIHGMMIVTRNIVDFDRFGSMTVNPWNVQSSGLHEPEAPCPGANYSPIAV